MIRTWLCKTYEGLLHGTSCNGWYFYIYLWQYKGLVNLLQILQTRIDRNIFHFFVCHMKGGLTFVLHTFYGKMCFVSHCLAEQDFFLLQWVSSLSFSCKGSPAQLLLSWSCVPSLTCSQNGLGKQSGPGAGEEWFYKPASSHHGGQQRRCPWEEGCKDLY